VLATVCATSRGEPRTTMDSTRPSIWGGLLRSRIVFMGKRVQQEASPIVQGRPFALGAEAWAQLPNVKRLFDAVNARPAAQRAMFPQNERLKG
jgi:hypothetical protein